jgi:hypothetical protein
MKKIIHGYLYDTDTATIIYEDKPKRRTYYMTENRHYFVVYRTKEFGVKTEEDIKELLGNNDVDKYIELFGDVEEA